MVAYKDAALNREEAHWFAMGLGAMMAHGGPRDLANPRKAAFIVVPSGKELELHEEGYTRDRDLVALAFQPGREHEGPTNIAVYERLINKVRINTHCAPWFTPNPRHFILASNEDEIGYGYCDARLLRIGPVPREDFELRLKQGRAELHRAAEAGRNEVPNPFRPH